MKRPPGFTSQLALYQSSRNYVSFNLRSGSSKSAVVPLIVTDPDIWQTPLCDPTDPSSYCYEPPNNEDFWYNFPDGGPDGGGMDIGGRRPRCWKRCNPNTKPPAIRHCGRDYEWVCDCTLPGGCCHWAPPILPPCRTRSR
jgi:hypothetical protein